MNDPLLREAQAMTAPPIVDGLEIMQADREAAAEYNRLFPELRLTEAFARHRIASTSTSHLQAASASVDEDRLRGLLEHATAGPWAALPLPGTGRMAIIGASMTVGAREVFTTPKRPIHVPDSGEPEANAALIVELRNTAPALLSELARLRAERDETAGALEPFAKAADAYPAELEAKGCGAGVPLHRWQALQHSLTVGDLRRARAALTASTKDDSHG